ncbi:MAG: hypothetical protein DI533_20675 [Cereibacter sphaeroides]|uniref:Uncharacterized protein n=1 Tax=Cereibacter sphaeroides TaxID=1063 RepID=A0A2W5TWC4_CERSP|nr:MAG: hypothetical protein DI533_20675 [Cereibacter sphaeroides]
MVVIARDLPVVLWEGLTPEQQAAAIAKYKPEIDGEWESHAEYFTYEPDSFVIIAGEVFDLDAEATAISESDLVGRFDRYLPSSDDGASVIYFSVVRRFDVPYLAAFRVEHVK